jgi:hypothetical protein
MYLMLSVPSRAQISHAFYVMYQILKLMRANQDLPTKMNLF